MYLEYYGLKREPFHITPDPSFLYLSPSHKEALGAIIYGVEKRKGFIAIIGEVGVGKTSILRAYLERKASRKQKTIYIFNPVLSFHDLLISMFRSLELTPRSDKIPEMVDQLHEALISEYQDGGTVVVAIDEAQNMPVETLENIRMFSNLETPTDKLIQIILLGQPELDNMLRQASLRQLKQRIALWAVISPLTREESHAFIEHRIARACTAGSALLFSEHDNIPVPFTKSALNLIVRKGKGIPRRINILCDNALITGFGRQCRPVPVSVVREIIGDIDSNRAAKPASKLKWVVGLSTAAILVVGLIVFFDLPARNGAVEIQSAVKRLDGNASSKGGESMPESSAIVSQQTHSPSAELSAATALGNSVDQNQRRMGLHGEPSVTGSDASPSVEVPSVALVKSRSDKQPGFLSNQDISKSKNHSLGRSVVQKSRSSDDSGESAYRKPASSSRVTQNATHDKAREGESALEIGVPISLAKGNAVREVREGESLSQIIMETYGTQSGEYIKWVTQYNPEIVNPDFIIPGQKIVLPTDRKNKEFQ